MSRSPHLPPHRKPSNPLTKNKTNKFLLETHPYESTNPPPLFAISSTHLSPRTFLILSLRYPLKAAHSPFSFLREVYIVGWRQLQPGNAKVTIDAGNERQPSRDNKGETSRCKHPCEFEAWRKGGTKEERERKGIEKRRKAARGARRK